MMSLRSVTGRELEWVKPRLFKRIYELRSGDNLLGEITFERPRGWTASARTGEGAWTLERTGFATSRVSVRSTGASNEVGSIQERRGRRTQQIALPDGSSFTLRSDFLKTRFILETNPDEPLVILRRRGIFRATWEAEIRYRARSIPQLPWLVMLMWFYVLMVRHRAHARGA